MKKILKVVNVYASINTASKYVKQEPTENEVEMNFNRNLSVIVSIRRQNIFENIKDFKVIEMM